VTSAAEGRRIVVNTRCVLCDGDELDPYCPGISRCRKGTLVFADATLTDQELLALYGQEYFCGAEYGDYLADRPVHTKNFGLRLKVLERFLDPSRHRSLLEIGSAYGFFLELVRRRFDSVVGIDITHEGVRFAREQLGLEAIEGDFLDQDFGSRTFDVVCMWDVMEHLRTPHLYLEKISAHSPPGSLIALTTGDVESLNARWRKERWRLIHPPTHLYYFSRKTIVAMLEKYGYEVIYNSYCGLYRSLNNIVWTVVEMRGRAPGLYRAMKKAGVLDGSVYLNLFDILYVVGRKRAVPATEPLPGSPDRDPSRREEAPGG
jgi:SAM-dependent methyltransferase